MARFSALVSRDAHVLDYGCGYGRVCRELQHVGYSNIVGVDPASRMIDRARAENPGITFHVLDNAALPFMAASFDAVVLFSVLTCIVHDDAQRAVVREIERALRPGGIVYVSDILLQEDERNRERYETGVRAFGRYGVFALEPGVTFRHLPRPWVDESGNGGKAARFRPAIRSAAASPLRPSFGEAGNRSGGRRTSPAIRPMPDTSQSRDHDDLPLPSVLADLHKDKPPLVLYHYTDQPGLLGIIKSKHIRATQVQHLSDRHELRHAFRLAKENIEARLTDTDDCDVLSTDERDALNRLKETLRQIKHNMQVGIASFSCNGDLLSQWRALRGSPKVCASEYPDRRRLRWPSELASNTKDGIDPV